jgi:hypothetical protein
MVNETPKPKRRRTKKPKLCEHGYPAIPNLRGCAACWTKHPGYVKPKREERKPPADVRQVTCEKCFLPSQPGLPPLRLLVTKAPDEPAKYAHRACLAEDDSPGGRLPRKMRRALRQGLVRSLRSHLRKMFRIERARRERAVVLRIEAARAERLLAAKRKESRGRRKARAS